MKINEYIESGILESYVLGSASKAETEELLFLKTKHPEIGDALLDLELDLERIAQHNAITPPPDVWLKIEDGINELLKNAQPEALVISKPQKTADKDAREGIDDEFIQVQAASNQMRVHKMWRWVLLGIFVLGKIFLGFAVYFYLQSRENAQEIKQLKTELEIQKKH